MCFLAPLNDLSITHTPIRVRLAQKCPYIPRCHTSYPLSNFPPESSSGGDHPQPSPRNVEISLYRNRWLIMRPKYSVLAITQGFLCEQMSKPLVFRYLRPTILYLMPYIGPFRECGLAHLVPFGVCFLVAAFIRLPKKGPHV